MSVTFTEREALRQLIEYIKEERARLFTEYTKAVGRLAELDKIEGLHINQDNNPIKNTTESESKETITTINNPIPVQEEGKGIARPKKMSLMEAVELHSRQNGYSLDQEQKEEVKQPQAVETKAKYDITKEFYKDFDAKNKPMKSRAKSSKYRDVKTITRDVVAILKEAGRPVKTQDILTELESRGVSTHSPYALIQQVQKYEPKIERAKFGYYQYRA